PTTVSITPGTRWKAASTPQKHPAPNVAISAIEFSLSYIRFLALIRCRRFHLIHQAVYDAFRLAGAARPFNLSWASARYGLFTEAACVKASLASGFLFKFSSANPSRYWLRA